MKTIFYRYIDYMDCNNKIQIILEEYISVKETPCGHWIIYSDADPWDCDPPKRWWVSNTSIKRRAYPDKDLALESFVLRKRSQIRILKNQLERANKAFDAGIKLMEEEDTLKKHRLILQKSKRSILFHEKSYL